MGSSGQLAPRLRPGQTPHQHDSPAPPSAKHREPHSINYQRQVAKTDAIDTWDTRWLNSDRRSKRTPPSPSHPQANSHPSFKARKAPNEPFCPPSFASFTGHAFIGSYTARFRPELPTSFPCGAPLQTVEHITACPHFTETRHDILRPVDRDASLPILFNTTQGGAVLSRFIKTTRACMLPRQVWDPGQPLP
jgi:hypothetical protein